MKENAGTLALKREGWLTLASLIAVAIAAPLLFKQQLIAGTIVNATLIAGAYFLGARYALLVGILPSTFALLAGTISPALAPMVPFIITGNILLILVFALLSRFSFWAGVLLGAAVKFALLYAASSLILTNLLGRNLAPAAAQAMSWPQLATALSGGVLAFAAIKLLRKSGRNNA